MNESEKHVMESMRNRRLTEVIFLHGYVQLLFNGAYLNAYTRPTVVTFAGAVDPTAAEYRDALRKLIGKVVKTVCEVPEERLSIQFDDGTSVEISLKAEDRVCAEAAMLQFDGGKLWNVW